MTSLVEKLWDVGIRLPSYSPGDRKILCPNCSHERRHKTDPCLSVSVDLDGENAVWMCHHCDWRGNTKDVIWREDRPRRPKPPPPPEDHVKPQTRELAAWFGHRGIQPAVVNRAKIYLTDHYMAALGGKVPCIAFPYYRGGDLVNVKYRAMSAKYFSQMKGGMPVFYGIDELVDGERVVIVEGELDKLSLDGSNVANALSVPDGAPARLRENPSDGDPKFEFLKNDWETLDRYPKIIIATDNDGPGNVLAEELARRLGKERCYRVRWPDQGDALCKDANETLMEHGPEVVRECIEAAEPYPIQGYHPWDPNVLRDRKTLGIERGIRTGWSNLDQHMTIAPGQFSVVTGIPNHGKSEFVDALVVNLAMRFGWKFALCSFENSVVEHEQKLAEKYLGLPFWDGPTREGMTLADIDKASEWGNQHFWFIRADDEPPTIDWILEKARVAVLRDGVNGLVIDPYNEIEHTRPNNMTETEYVSQILGRVKRFAQNHGVHVWFIAHPAKMARDGGKVPVPGLYDISGSAHWANKADIGLTVYRPDVESTEVEIHVQKVRHKWIGRPGKVTLEYDRVTGRYSEPESRPHWSDR